MKFFLIRALHKLGLVEQVNMVVPRPLNGTTIQVPVLQGLGYDNLQVTEQWMCSLLKSILAKTRRGTFIDVGVNVGQTLLKLRSIDAEVDYVGFEPNPRCVYYADVLIKANGFRNCRIIPVGLADKNSVLQLNLYSQTDTDSAASLVENFRPDQKIFKKIYVPVSRFDTVDEQLNIPSISIIKIDVEGAELEVLQGLTDTIRKNRPVVIMEILPAYKAENTFRIERQDQIQSIFKGLDYRTFRIIKSGSRVEKLLPLDQIEVHDNGEWCDYVFAPSEIGDQISTLS